MMGFLGPKERIDGDAVRRRQVANVRTPGRPAQRLVELRDSAAGYPGQPGAVTGTEGFPGKRVRPEITHLAWVTCRPVAAGSGPLTSKRPPSTSWPTISARVAVHRRVGRW